MQIPRYWCLGIVRAGFLCSFLFGVALADEVVSPWEISSGEEENPSISNTPFTQLEISHLSQLDNDGFGINTLDLRRRMLVGYGDLSPMSITPGFAFHMWNGPNGLDLPARVYDVTIDFEWQALANDRSSLILGSTPGLYGDFDGLDSKTLQWSGWLAGTYHLNSNWLAMGGIAYIRQLDSNWLPIGGVIWTPNDRIRVDFLFPRPKVTRLLRRNEQGMLSWYWTGHYDGGAWSVRDTPSSHVLVSYSDLRLLTGLEGALANGSTWKAEFGYAFSRDISVERVSVSNPSDALLFECSFSY
jgi:hypothetical protein